MARRHKQSKKAKRNAVKYVKPTYKQRPQVKPNITKPITNEEKIENIYNQIERGYKINKKGREIPLTDTDITNLKNKVGELEDKILKGS